MAPVRKDRDAAAAETAEVTPPSVATAPTDGIAASSVGGGRVFASPRARRLADDAGVDLAHLAGRGTGPGGRIQEKDVVAYQAEVQAAGDALLSETAAVAGRAPKASPLARAVAGEAGLDLANLTGTGTGGRITAGDVRDAAAPEVTPERAAAPATPAPGSSRTITLSGLRKRVADNIARSVQRAPHVTLHLRADMTGAQRLRADLLPAIEKITGGVRLSPTDIIVKAAARALEEFPYVNAHIEGDTITLFDDVHVGLAVSLGEEGLIVPVIRDAHRRGLADIARARHDLAARARSGKLAPDDLAGGTFSVSNLGGYGIESFNPIIAPPQVAILGIGAIQDEIVASNGAPAVRPMMGLSLSFDHRAMDGAPAGAFLQRLRELLENPSLLLA
jgi:pyruvate dehydrogenase E2 component (dihydrolipoamide acetyltransferase)